VLTWESVHFDTTLNLVWLLLGLWALASTARASYRRAQGSAPKWLHVVGVGLIVAALFPYISATDDILRIEQYTAQHDQQHNSGKRSHSDDLIRLYETMDSPLVCRTSEIVLTLSFAWLVFTPVLKRIDRSTPFITGRSPPFPTNA
jgi:hypothetical protein